MNIIKEKNEITVITYGGKLLSYSKEDIKEIIDDFDTYIGADDLPKWLYVITFIDKDPDFIKFIKSKEKISKQEMILNFLKKLLTVKSAIINVQTDKKYKNFIRLYI